MPEVYCQLADWRQFLGSSTMLHSFGKKLKITVAIKVLVFITELLLAERKQWHRIVIITTSAVTTTTTTITTTTTATTTLSSFCCCSNDSNNNSSLHCKQINQSYRAVLEREHCYFNINLC